jgi:hypothetical protein
MTGAQHRQIGKPTDPARGECLLRRHWFSQSVRWSLTGWLVGGVAGSVRLIDRSQADDLPLGADASIPPTLSGVRSTRNRSVVEIDGAMRVPTPGGKIGQEKQQRFQAVSTLDYQEHYVGDPLRASRVVRQFSEAELKGQYGDVARHRELADQRRLVLAWRDQQQWVYNSPDQPLLAAESDLAEGWLASWFLDAVQIETGLSTGASVPLPLPLVAGLFRLDTVQSSTLAWQLADRQGDIQRLTLRGEVAGGTAGGATEFSLQGKAHWDTEAKLVRWIGLSVKERRQPTAARPGYDVQARIRLIRQPIEKATAETTLDGLSWLSGPVDANMMRLRRIESPVGGYHFLASDQWVLISDSGDRAVMRLIDQQQTLAQCSISVLVPLEPGRQLTLEGFQADCIRALGESFGSLVESHEGLTSGGLRRLTVVMDGQSRNLPMRWVSVHVSDDSGRRLTLSFASEGQYADRLAAADQQIIDSMVMVDLETSEEPPESTDSTEAARRAASALRAGSPR